ncbi:MAG: hypothetical protein HC780_13170 [Leptolyngbyaceae cyanobacterium CSU_1_3]|nr:hypothetical protein [Leptolyngbyaceae cyanobacterium CSU_1_3]
MRREETGNGLWSPPRVGLISPTTYTLSGHKIKDFGRGAGVEPLAGRSPHTPSKPKSIG